LPRKEKKTWQKRNAKSARIAGNSSKRSMGTGAQFAADVVMTKPVAKTEFRLQAQKRRSKKSTPTPNVSGWYELPLYDIL